MKKIRRAIVSVTDKTGVVEFSKALAKMGVEIISTGGTARLLEEKGVQVIPIASYTGFPEMLDGRVKTLHPKIHGGILGMRENDVHAKEMETHGILPIDMVVVNLYAFEKTVEKGAALEETIENIDIGGPTMIRAAAKNFKDVTSVIDPGDYKCVIDEMKKNDGAVTEETRFALAKKVFQLTARYDGAISNYLGGAHGDEQARRFPETFTLQLKKLQDLRYGENPHQAAAFYQGPESPESPSPQGSLSGARKLQGKELSYNNILDLDAAITLAREFHEPAAVIIKHNNPCGTAMSKEGLVSAYTKALACDSKSAFGGIVGFNGTVTVELANRLADIFLEAVVAPGFEKKALEIFKKKKNLRVVETGEPAKGAAKGEHAAPLELKRVSGGFLLQTPDRESASDLKTVTQRGPTDTELEDLLFAWNVVKHVKSNAIVIARCTQTIGIGAGQMSRIDSTRIAAMKAKDAGLEIQGSVLASDAFFPFRDNVDLASERGITAIIQPGGSVRDEEVIEAANDHDIAMVFTGIRHFRH